MHTTKLVQPTHNKGRRIRRPVRDKRAVDILAAMVVNLHDSTRRIASDPKLIQSTVWVFVLLISVLVLLQQALSSGYINSVITTIEKRFEIPSSLSGLIASSYEIGNVFTVIFVSYLGSQRHIPVWIGVGVVSWPTSPFAQTARKTCCCCAEEAGIINHKSLELALKGVLYSGEPGMFSLVRE
ncbi:hypothetical protein PR048_012069 [Dryococelus australis]|uniref:Uncharacterized protein n=1 Tax=Dryococelus australis TaxID=614101 RepID=A0ABQ9HPL3_9NEOP|nr:hypothetical protein PR048_012069 [Dryococelus australis]